MKTKLLITLLSLISLTTIYAQQQEYKPEDPVIQLKYYGKPLSDADLVISRLKECYITLLQSTEHADAGRARKEYMLKARFILNEKEMGGDVSKWQEWVKKIISIKPILFP